MQQQQQARADQAQALRSSNRGETAETRNQVRTQELAHTTHFAEGRRDIQTLVEHQQQRHHWTSRGAYPPSSSRRQHYHLQQQPTTPQLAATYTTIGTGAAVQASYNINRDWTTTEIGGQNPALIAASRESTAAGGLGQATATVVGRGPPLDTTAIACTSSSPVAHSSLRVFDRLSKLTSGVSALTTTSNKQIDPNCPMCQAPPPNTDISQDPVPSAAMDAQLFPSHLMPGISAAATGTISGPQSSAPLSIHSMEQLNSLLGLQQLQPQPQQAAQQVKTEEQGDWAAAALDPATAVEGYAIPNDSEEQKLSGSAEAVAALPAEPIRTLLSAGVRIQGRSTRELLEKATHIRQRRRESAARSRQRRAKYFVDLEEENKHLRDENHQLKAILRSLEERRT